MNLSSIFFNLKDAKSYAESIGALFIETSAKSSHNIHELFCSIGEFNTNDYILTQIILSNNN